MEFKLTQFAFSSCILVTVFIVILADNRLESGKAQYELIQKEIAGGLPKYSECWLNAMKNLHSGCKAISDDTQHRLSLQFTNCFLAKSGRQTYLCANDEQLEVCTKDMSPEAFGVYTGFFTHTQNMCYFLQAQVWQEETDNTIHRLEQSSDDVAKHLEQSNVRQQQLLSMQNESIKLQESIMAHGNQLMETVATSAISVRSMTNDFMEVLYEQKSLIFGVFEKLSSLQSIVLGEFTGFYSFIFYLCSIILCYLLTSTQRTQGSRFWLFIIMTINVFAERLLVTLTVDATVSLDAHGKPVDNSELVYWRLWQCRKVFICIAAFVYLWCACKYRDLNLINNQMLAQIQKQNEEIQRMLQAAEMNQQSRVWLTGGQRKNVKAASSGGEKEAEDEPRSRDNLHQPAQLPPPPLIIDDTPSQEFTFPLPASIPNGSQSIDRRVADLTPTPSSSPDDGSERSATPATRRRRRRDDASSMMSVMGDVLPDTPGSGRYNLRPRKPSSSPAARSPRTPAELNAILRREELRSGSNLSHARSSISRNQLTPAT